MTQITMDIPVLVRRLEVEGESQYQIRPLFYSYPSVMNRRYEKAEWAFRKEMKQYFMHYEMNRETLPNFAWFQFHPEVSYEHQVFEFNFTKQFIRGNFAYGHFSVAGHKVVFLPNFNNFMFFAQPNEQGKYDLKSEAYRVMERLFRNYKKNMGGGTIEAEQYQSDKSEFKSSVTCSVSIKGAPFPFEADPNALFFASMMGQTEFDGAHELNKVGRDLNEGYPSALLSAWYREEEVNRLQATVFSQDNTPLVILGPKGVGRKSVLHEALYRYIKTQGDENLEQHQKIWHIDPTRIISGMSIVGMWQKRFEAILSQVKKRRAKIKEIKDSATDKILFDNPVALLRIGVTSQNNMTLSDVLKPYLEKRMLQLILIATPEEWKIVQEKDRRFSDLFTILRVEEPDGETAAKMVLQRRKLLELEYHNTITAHAIHKLFGIHRSYFRRNALPGGVMTLLHQLAVKYKSAQVDLPEVIQEFEDFSGLRENMVDDTQTFGKDEIQSALSAKLVGQPDAVEALADTLHAIKAKLVDPTKPKGSFLFIGPTGVGKTQAAKVLAEFLLGGESHLLRFDMNEYLDEQAASRLIGDAANPEGHLTGKVRYHPFGIVLLDEIEKAHPKVHDLLLQVLDDGRLTDSLGRTVDFSNTLIIMTSNIGAEQVASRLGFGHITTEVDAVYRKAVENHFRPEFVNRIDKTVIFQPLQQPFILNIARLQINELLKRDGFVRRTTILNISSEALEWVARRGFDAKMGGRALKRQIEKDLTALSAEQLLESDAHVPVILDICLKDEQLHPEITPLNFVEASPSNGLPNLPNQQQARSYYGQLFRTIERMEEDIRRFEEQKKQDNDIIVIGGDTDELDWQYYGFKDRIVDTKEKVRETMLGFRDNYFKGGPALPLRLKGGGLGSFIQKSDTSVKGYKEFMKDRFFQKEALKEINEFYRLADNQFDSLNTEYLDNYLDVAFFALYTRGFLLGYADEVRLEYRSCIEGKGRKELSYLMDLHKKFFKASDIPYEVDEAQGIITAEAHALYDIIKVEHGIHLFYRSHETPLPLRVQVELLGANEATLPNRVIRLYDLKTTLSDLRTGFSNDVNITPQEFKLLLFGAWDEELRKEVMRE